EAAFGDGGDRLEVDEGRFSHVDAEGPGAAVGYGVDAEFPAGGFDGRVDLPGGDAEAFGDQFEVVDEGFHGLAHDVPDVVETVAHAVGAEGELGRPGDLLVLDHDRAGLEFRQALLDDLEALADLLEAEEVAGPGVGAVVRGDVELVVLVAAVGLGLAQVPAEAGAAEHRSGDAEGEAAGDVEVAHALGAFLPD